MKVHALDCDLPPDCYCRDGEIETPADHWPTCPKWLPAWRGTCICARVGEHAAFHTKECEASWRKPR